MEINGYTLVQTCGACPEQYDVFKDDKQVGYLRLRHGYFRADYPDCGGETVYEAEPNGDGIFNPDERDGYLREAVAAIDRRVRGIEGIQTACPATWEIRTVNGGLYTVKCRHCGVSLQAGGTPKCLNIESILRPLC